MPNFKIEFGLFKRKRKRKQMSPASDMGHGHFLNYSLILTTTWMHLSNNFSIVDFDGFVKLVQMYLLQGAISYDRSPQLYLIPGDLSFL